MVQSEAGSNVNLGIRVATVTNMSRHQQKGSVAVECALSIPLLVLLLLVVIQFLFLCIERQLMNYAAFMAARSRMVRADGGYKVLAKKIVPWAKAEASISDPDNLSVKVRGHKSIFNLSASPLGKNYGDLTATVPVYPHPQTSTSEEDNPICTGGAQC